MSAHTDAGRAGWVILDTDGGVVDRFFSESEALSELTAGYPDGCTVGYDGDPYASAFDSDVTR